MAILIEKGITTEDEIFGVMKEVANSDAVKQSVEKIKRFAGLLQKLE